MAVSIETCTVIKVDGYKGVWKVPPDMIVTADDTTYLRLLPYSAPLVRMLCELSANAPIPMPKNFSLTSSCGYKALVRLRNDVQQRELADEQQPKVTRRLFDVAPQAAKKRRVCRDAMKDMRQQPRTLAIDVPSGDVGDTVSVSVLRPVHPKDCLAVALDAQALSAVFAYICERDFEVTDYYKQDKSLPKGIWKRHNGYLVAHDVGGATRYKLMPTKDDNALDNAIAFQANPSSVEPDGEYQSNEDGCDEAGVHAPLHDMSEAGAAAGA